MDKETMGTVISVATQWWLKINTKPVRKHALDGATFPHIIKVKYTVDGKDYIKRKWISANSQPPMAGSSVTVLYSGDKPQKAKILTEASYQKDTMLLKDQQESAHQTQYMPIGMCLGMSLGVAIGTATDNLATYMPIGLSIGLAIGAMIDAKKRKDSQENKEE